MELEVIKITKVQKQLLDSLKIHPKQPYHEVIQQIIDISVLPPCGAKKSKEIIRKLKHLQKAVRKRMGDKLDE